MIRLETIQWAAGRRDKAGLRELFMASRDAGIEGCAAAKKDTLRLSMIEAALFGTPGLFGNLDACLSAIRQGASEHLTEPTED